MTEIVQKNHLALRRRVFAAGFFLTLGAALSYYVNSSFLESLVGKGRVGAVYFGSALVAIIIIILVARGARRFGLLRIARLLGLVLASGYLGLNLISSPATALVFFVITHAAGIGLGLCLDLYLEGLSLNRQTGRIRGGYLTLINAAVLLSPFASGSTVNYFDHYRSIYLLSFLAVLPLLYLLYYRLTEQTPFTNQTSFGEKIERFKLARILGLDFLLNLFYSIMVIYLPLRLHQELGFTWTEIGALFTVMLVPFVFIQYPLGRLADRRWGEKKILTVGLLIAGFSTLPIGFLDSKNWLVWAGILFLTRVGASAWEAMKESYLFKRVNVGDVGIISLSRLMVPLAYLVGAGSSLVLLKFISTAHLFTLLGLLVISGIVLSLRLTDSR